MAYQATWMKGAEIVGEEVFDDLLEAQAAVLQHMLEYQEKLGADSVRVWNGRAIFFQVDKGQR